MATYSFATITQEQAQQFNIVDFDTLIFPTTSATDVKIEYAPQANGFGVYRITVGAKTVEFPQAGAFFGLPAASLAGRLRFADGSQLILGSDFSDSFVPDDNHFFDNHAIFGGGGADELFGGDGDDVINGGAGADFLFGEGGSDSLNGGLDDDQISGGDGADFLQGDRGDDVLDGGDGVDTIFGGIGDDVLLGGTSGDVMNGDAGADMMMGEDGNDSMQGGPGDDLLAGGRGTDWLVGGTGADTLRGGLNSDTIEGGAGADTIEGGAGADAMAGGSGADVYVFGTVDSVLATPDQIFDLDDEDVLDFAGLPAATPLNFRFLPPQATANAALLGANAAFAALPSLTYVAVPVGDDIHIYVDSFEINQAFSLVVLRDTSFFDPFLQLI